MRFKDRGSKVFWQVREKLAGFEQRYYWKKWWENPRQAEAYLSWVLRTRYKKLLAQCKQRAYRNPLLVLCP